MSDANNNSGNTTGTTAIPFVIPQSSGYTITLPTLTPGNVIIVPQGQWISVGSGWVARFPDSPAEASAEAEPKEEAGYSCKRCDTYCEMVKPNQEDGTFICWKCRHGY